MDDRSADAELIRLTARIAAGAGYDIQPALEAAGIRPAALDLPDPRVTIAQAHCFIHTAQTTTGREDLGLLVGTGQRLTSWGILGLGMLASDTVEQALGLGLRYRGLAGALAEVRVEPAASGVEFLADPLPGLEEVGRFVAEELFSSIVGMLRLAAGDRAQAIVEFAFPPPSSGVALSALDGSVFYDRPRSRLLLTDRTLALELPTADRVCRAKMIRLLDVELAERRRRHGFVAQVEAYITDRLSGPPTIATAAEHFHLSERTLRRRLGGVGITYQDLLDGCRRDHARRLVADPRLTQVEIARACGLSDDRSLRRAMRRWDAAAS